MLNSESNNQPDSESQATALRRADGADFIRAARDYVRGVLSADGEALGTPTIARQKEGLREWARSLGLLLAKTLILPARNAVDRSMIFSAKANVFSRSPAFSLQQSR